MRVGKTYPKHNIRDRYARAKSSIETLTGEIDRLTNMVDLAIRYLQAEAPRMALDRLLKARGRKE